MRVETVRCDQCGAIKGEGNHWLYVDVEKLAPWDSDGLHAPAKTAEIMLGHAVVIEGYERHDLCGQDCFHKHLDALLFTPKQPLMDSGPFRPAGEPMPERHRVVLVD